MLKSNTYRSKKFGKHIRCMQAPYGFDFIPTISWNWAVEQLRIGWGMWHIQFSKRIL